MSYPYFIPSSLLWSATAARASIDPLAPVRSGERSPTLTPSGSSGGGIFVPRVPCVRFGGNDAFRSWGNSVLLSRVSQRKPRTVNVDLSVWVTDSPDPCAQWVTARAAGILIPDPAGGAVVSSCEELRKILLDTGQAVMRLMTPDDAPRFRI